MRRREGPMIRPRAARRRRRARRSRPAVRRCLLRSVRRACRRLEQGSRFRRRSGRRASHRRRRAARTRSGCPTTSWSAPSASARTCAEYSATACCAVAPVGSAATSSGMEAASVSPPAARRSAPSAYLLDARGEGRAGAAHAVVDVLLDAAAHSRAGLAHPRHVLRHAGGDAVEPAGLLRQCRDAAGDAVDAVRVLGHAVGVLRGAVRGIRGPRRGRADPVGERAEPVREPADARRQLRRTVGGVAERAAHAREVRVEPLEVLGRELAAEGGRHRVADRLRDRTGEVAVRVVGADVEVRLGRRFARDRRHRLGEVGGDREHDIGVARSEQLGGFVVVRDGPCESGGLGTGEFGDQLAPGEHGLLGAVGQRHGRPSRRCSRRPRGSARGCRRRRRGRPT